MLAGIFVFISGKLLVPGILVIPPLILLVSLILELVDWLPVELLGVF